MCVLPRVPKLLCRGAAAHPSCKCRPGQHLSSPADCGKVASYEKIRPPQFDEPILQQSLYIHKQQMCASAHKTCKHITCIVNRRE